MPSDHDSIFEDYNDKDLVCEEYAINELKEIMLGF
jgi:hypothetical protein